MIEKIKIGLNNLYLFKNKNDEYLLLDTGINVKNKEILKKLIQKIGDIKKIKVIVLSHSHSDHVGNLKMLIDEIGDVKVIAHRNSENVLETGKSVIPNGFYWFTEKISKKLKSKKNFSKNIFPKLEKKDMEKLIFIDFLQQEKILLLEYGFGNMKIIETKGHSDDSISIEVFDEKNNGIVDNWGECEKIVHGTKARYKSFIDKSVAQEWLDSGASYERNIGLNAPINATLEKGIYFDAGTGRGIGVEVRITNENKENILDKISPSALKKLLKDTTWIKNEFGNIQVEPGKTNNFGELIGFYFALNCAKILKQNVISGDSRLVIDYWSLGRFHESNLESDTINYINKVILLRKEFEKNKGVVKHISGDINPADLGFHK